jgi:thiamine biosynthesis lipoprotein
MNLHVESFRAMGSPCELRLHARSAAEARAAVAAATAVIERLEARYSRYRPDSLTTRINAAAGTPARIEVDAETAALLDYAATAHAESGGRFDPTSGVLRRAWDFRSGRVPSQAEIDALLPLVGWQQVEWTAPTIRLPRAGMELDFGGWVKEYAADAAAAACREAGVAHGLVELGGDIRVIGPQPDGTPWRVGVRHPRDASMPLAVVDLAEGAIASSGDYERCMVIDGRRYAHILDPRSGWPVRGLAAVSVLAPSCLLAGTAATIAMLHGEAGRDWLATLGVPHRVVSCAEADGGRVGTG